MRIKLNSVFVGDQEQALQFYTQVLGFSKAKDIPLGEYRWLTVVSPDEPECAELLLEPNAHPAAVEFQKAMFESGIAATAFEVDDIDEDFKKLSEAGVEFPMSPTDVGTAVIATLDDTCGNIIQIYQTT